MEDRRATISARALMESAPNAPPPRRKAA